MLDIASKVCSLFCSLTHIRLSPQFLAPRFSHQTKVFNNTRLPQEAHKKIYHMLKTWKLIQSQRSILSQFKNCCRSTSNFTIYKTTPSFFRHGPRRKEGGCFLYPQAAAFTRRVTLKTVTDLSNPCKHFENTLPAELSSCTGLRFPPAALG